MNVFGQNCVLFIHEFLSTSWQSMQITVAPFENERVINHSGAGINWDEHQEKEEILQIKFGCQFTCLKFKGKS